MPAAFRLLPCWKGNGGSVVGDAEIVQLLQHGADHVVVLGHAVRMETDAGAALGRPLQMRPHVHAGGVEPNEERLAGLGGAVGDPLP